MRNSIWGYLIKNQFLVALLVIALAWFAIEIKEILVILFISFIIMSTLFVFVDFLKKKHVPHILAVLISYAVALSIVVMLIVPLVPFFVSQLQSLFANFPKYVNETARLLNLKIDLADINKLLGADLNAIGRNTLLFTGKVFSGIFSLLAILVLSFYFMLEREKINKQIASLFPKESAGKVLATIYKMENVLGAWFRGQIMLSFIIGISTWIALTIFGLPSALPLALLAGILEIVPTIGPIISSIPAIIVALTISPTVTIAVIVFYTIIQALENNFLVPKIMQRVVGLNPIVVIVGVMIGGQLMGILGALLSIPFIAMLITLFKSRKNNHQIPS